MLVNEGFEIGSKPPLEELIVRWGNEHRKELEKISNKWYFKFLKSINPFYYCAKRSTTYYQKLNYISDKCPNDYHRNLAKDQLN